MSASNPVVGQRNSLEIFFRLSMAALSTESQASWLRHAAQLSPRMGARIMVLHAEWLGKWWNLWRFTMGMANFWGNLIWTICREFGCPINAIWEGSTFTRQIVLNKSCLVVSTVHVWVETEDGPPSTFQMAFHVVSGCIFLEDFPRIEWSWR